MTNQPKHDDESCFSGWAPGSQFNDSLQLEGCELNDEAFKLTIWSPNNGRVLIETETHQLVKYSNESASFLEFGGLPIAKQRMYAARDSKWLAEFKESSSGIFDDLIPKHYLFICSNASIEMICTGEVNIRIINENSANSIDT